MATLIQEATAARARRASARSSLEQRRTALEALEGVQDRLEAPLPSPWSTLQWSHNYRPLAEVLVPVP